MIIKNAIDVILNFKDKVDITDPCYDDDVLWRFSGELVPGEYRGTVDFCDGRVSQIKICKTDKTVKQWKYIGEIEVDSGNAGFFDDKPNFTDDEWADFCDKLKGVGAWKGTFNGRDGFFSRSGWGDGAYPVYTGYDRSTRPIAYKIIF